MTPLRTLTEDQHILVKEYNEVLLTVEEGFDYVIQSFSNLEKTEGDRILSDIFQAFSQIVKVNEQLYVLFGENAKLKGQLENFEAVLENAMSLRGKLDDTQAKEMIIRDQLYPAFTGWSNAVRKELKTYTQS